MKRIIGHIIAAIVIAATLSACSSTRHVPQGHYLLNSVKIDVDGNKEVTPSSLLNYVRQQPNHKVLGFARIQLGIYNMSGNDSTKWYNRWARSLGHEPVIYDSELTEQSRRQINLALINRGYNDATVTVDTIKNQKKRKIDLVYHVTTGDPHVIENISYRFDNQDLHDAIMADSAKLTIARGAHLNRDLLDNERSMITSRLRDKGYYGFNKDHITFIADTAAGSRQVDLTMWVHGSNSAGVTDTLPSQRRYLINRVIVNVEGLEGAKSERPDTVRRKDFVFVYSTDHYLRPSVIEEKCFITPGQPYNATDVNRTYEALSRLGIIKYLNISMEPAMTFGDTGYLNAVITMSRNKKQGVTFEVEGTNSEGDLGFGVGLTYQHRNLAHGSELLTAKLRTSYESLSGNLDGFINNNYIEVSGEVGITFPKFEAPLLSRSFKKKVRASTEFAVSMNYQERPEYTRIISGLAWKYRWNNPQNTWRHTWDLLDLNLVYLPRSTIDFINNIAPGNPLLRYSYEDHLIMRMGFTYYRTNNRQTTVSRMAPIPFNRNIWSLRTSVETAGNTLYALSSLSGQKRHQGAYKVFGVQYAQYAKMEVEGSWLHRFDRRNCIALHSDIGIGVPYGNSSMIPFEKRFYAGGANSVRGWNVRSLGPGSYNGRNYVTDFINQCGDIKFDFNVEYRAKLFWVMEGALFVDAGNIWTIHKYPNQPGGEFRFNTFYKQIALAYGAGLRFDFTYFLLRLDLGMKAHNPAEGQLHWPLLHPNWSRDRALHLSIGYPF